MTEEKKSKNPFIAAAIAQRDEMKLALRDLTDAAKELMDCKGYDLYPDGTMRPAHGLGEWVKAEDYDKLHAAAEAAQAEIAMLKNEYICKCGLRVTPHRCKTGEEDSQTDRFLIGTML